MRRVLLLAAAALLAATSEARRVGSHAISHHPSLLALRGGRGVPQPVEVHPEKKRSFTAAGEKARMTAAVVGIVGLWLAVATVYYAKHEAWPYAQSFFYAVDTGMSIGFGTVAEKHITTKAFTILHVLLGASAVGGAIALFAESAISGAASVAGSEYARASVRAAFARADTDHSGSLSNKEFEAVLRSVGLELPPQEMAAAVDLFDDDNSGSIEIDEFLAVVEPYVDSNTPVADAVRLVVQEKRTHPLVRVASSVWKLVCKHRVIALWVIWIAAGAAWGMLTEGWDLVSATYFAVGALATGGLEGPALNAAGTIPDRQALFVGIYCLSGIPVFAMALGQFANILIEGNIAAREQRALSQPITEDEFEFAQQLVSNDGAPLVACAPLHRHAFAPRLADGRTRTRETASGKIDLSEFVVLELYRLGKLDANTIRTIKAEFKRLDKNGDGTIRKIEVLGHSTA